MRSMQLARADLLLPKLILPNDGHKCTAMVVDPRHYPATQIYVWIKGVHGAAKTEINSKSVSLPERHGNMMTAIPGQVIPLEPGAETWIEMRPVGEYNFGPGITEPVTVTLFEKGDNAIVSDRSRNVLGHLLWQSTEQFAAASGVDKVLLDSDSLSGLNGLPVHFRVRLFGGGVADSGISSDDDYPLELVLQEYAGSSGVIKNERAWVFPGVGECGLTFNVHETRRELGISGQGGWRLLARYPSGAANPDKDGAAYVQLYAGHAEKEVERYRVIHRQTGITTTDQWGAFAIQHVAGSSARQQTYNNATAGTHVTRMTLYIPSTNGGPLRTYVAADSCAAMARRSVGLSTEPIIIGAGNYSTSPTNGDVSWMIYGRNED